MEEEDSDSDRNPKNISILEIKTIDSNLNKKLEDQLLSNLKNSEKLNKKSLKKLNYSNFSVKYQEIRKEKYNQLEYQYQKKNKKIEYLKSKESEKPKVIDKQVEFHENMKRISEGIMKLYKIK